MSFRIDRASFLSLTFGMAACNTGPSPAVAASVVDIPAQPPPPADAGAPVVLSPPAREPAPAVSEPLAVDTVDDDTDDDVGSSVSEGGGHASAPAAACGFVDAKKLARPSAPCGDDLGPTPSCSATRACSGFPFPKQQCESYLKYFKPKVAERAVTCLAKLTSKQTCNDACTTYRCGDVALKMACPDPAADASCQQITAKCRSVSMTDCRTYLSGLNPTGRAKMVTCLTSKAGCGFGIFSCSESL